MYLFHLCVDRFVVLPLDRHHPRNEDDFIEIEDLENMVVEMS